MVVPNPNDTHRERWETLPVWQELQGVFSELPFFAVERKAFDFSRVPKDSWLFQNGFAALTSFMAKEGIDDFETGFQELTQRADEYLSRFIDDPLRGLTDEPSMALTSLRNYVCEKILEKRVRFNKPVAGKLPRAYWDIDFKGVPVDD